MMKKQPELPEFARDLEIVQSLNRTLNVQRESMNAGDAEDVSDSADVQTP